MSSSLLESITQISTSVRCNNCGITISRVNWKQCILCKKFNLCEDCEKYSYDKLELFSRKNHIKIHENIGNNNLITSEYMQPILMKNALKDLETLNEKFYSIMEEKKIQNDNEMAVVLTKLKQVKNDLLTDSEQKIKQELCSMIVDYHMRAFDIIIRVLSLDGGGKRRNIYIKIR